MSSLIILMDYLPICSRVLFFEDDGFRVGSQFFQRVVEIGDHLIGTADVEGLFEVGDLFFEEGLVDLGMEIAIRPWRAGNIAPLGWLAYDWPSAWRAVLSSCRRIVLREQKVCAYSEDIDQLLVFDDIVYGLVGEEESVAVGFVITVQLA